MSNGRLAEQVAWITGAGSGIGKGIAQTFAAEGAKVAVVELDAKAAKTAAEEIGGKRGAALAIACDVSKEQQVKDSIEKTVAEFGGLQIIINYHVNKTPHPKETLARRLSRVPLGIALTPEDIAKAAVYFSCEDSAGITGTSLIVDAGYLACAEWG